MVVSIDIVGSLYMFIKHGCIYRYCGITVSMVVSIDIVGSLYMFIKHVCIYRYCGITVHVH